MGLADQTLSEADYRRLILEEYTFLKRPVFLTDAGVTAGSAKAEVPARATSFRDPWRTFNPPTEHHGKPTRVVGRGAHLCLQLLGCERADA